MIPVAIGGLGGSGTRVVAELITMLGYYIGDELNEALDNLWFTLLFKRPSILVDDAASFSILADAFANRMQGGAISSAELSARVRAIAWKDCFEHPLTWRELRAASFLGSASTYQPGQPWGWKEPNTHIVIEELLSRFSDLRYIHLRRSPFDMAFSGNQNQLRNWGPIFLDGPVVIDPPTSFSYWCHVERRMERLAQRFGDRVLVLKFEDICENSSLNAQRVAALLNCRIDSEITSRFEVLARLPATTGRGARTAAAFRDVDKEFAQRLGF